MCVSSASIGRVKFFYKVTQSSLPTLLTLCFLNIKVSLPQTKPPASDPFPYATHHRPPIHSSAPLITDCISTAISTTHWFTSLSFSFSFRYPLSSSAPLFLGHFHRRWFILLISILDFFFPFIAMWLYRFGFLDGLWVMGGWVCGLWWMVGMFCGFLWWLSCGSWVGSWNGLWVEQTRSELKG